MDAKDATKIGGRLGIISTVIGVVIADVIYASFDFERGMPFYKRLFWFIDLNFDYDSDFRLTINFLIGIIVFILSGYFYGRLAGKWVLIKNKNEILIGMLTGILVLLTTAFLCGWTGVIQELISEQGSTYNILYDYIFKPFYWISLFGSIPAILVGMWFGTMVKRMGRKVK